MIGRGTSFIALALVLVLGACGVDTPMATEQPLTPQATPTAAVATPSPVEPTMTPLEVTEPDPAATQAPAVTPTPLPTVQETPTVPPTPMQTPDDEPEPGCLRLTDFEVDAENLAWFVVNDNVMGGLSSGGPAFDASAMTFEGAINTNGGGFSSVRVQLGLGAFDGFTGLQVRARTDDRPYKVILEDALETRDRRVSHQAPLVFEGPTDDGWQIARVNFADLGARIFGREVTSDAFRPDLANQLGIMLSDNIDGQFRVDIDWIDICR